MWGNFGAALQANLAAWLLLTYDKSHDQRILLIAGACAFALAGVLSFGINAAREESGGRVDYFRFSRRKRRKLPLITPSISACA